MFVPLISRTTPSKFEKRKGGGGGRGGGGRSGSSRGSKSSSGSTKTATKTTKTKINYPDGNSKGTSAYGTGGGIAAALPAGVPFAGRLAGGGKRSEVFGTKTYGSGYKAGDTTRGVAGRGFPFFFWPVVWGSGTFVAGKSYLDARDEYGDVNNTTRPGGPLSTATFLSSSTPSTTFRILADNDTVVELISDLAQNCSSRLNLTPPPSPLPLNASTQTTVKPEQVVQYYRASSIALTLDGYNNSATYAPEGTADSALPSGVDMGLLACLNETIGAAAPLVDGVAGGAFGMPSYFNLVALVWTVWALLRLS